MTTMRFNPNKQLWLFLVTVFVSIHSANSYATAAFARATGANCNKCHTLAFPRLTPMGEKFMRNGFQMPKEDQENGGFGLADDVPEAGKKSDLPNVGDYLSVTGTVSLVDFNANTTTPEFGNPTEVGILATGSVAENTPIWVGIDVENGVAGIHSYIIGKTNINDSTLLNLRAGTLDPTTWTSFAGHGGAVDSANPDIGSYGGHHGDETGFDRVGPGYTQRNGLEYYGYTDSFIWNAGLVNGDVNTSATTHAHASGNHDAPDFWLSSRMNFDKSGSMSLLWYKANGSYSDQALTAAANYRTRALDLRAQYSMELGQHSENMGYTLQVDYALTRELLGTLRFDGTDNGLSDGTEQQLTFGVVFKPKPNIKLTAAYVAEITSAKMGPTSHSDATPVAKDPFGDHGTLKVRFMF